MNPRTSRASLFALLFDPSLELLHPSAHTWEIPLGEILAQIVANT
jgi:hypothetical protein